MNAPSILIVGGGIAGLSAGIYAQKNGFQSTIVEMHDKAGGQLTAWKRQGFNFDYCLHWLVGTDHGAYHDVWQETKAITEEVEVINHRVFIKLSDETHGSFLIYNDLDEWETYLIREALEDEKAIRKLCGMMRKGDQLDQFENPPGMRTVLDYFKSFVHMGSFIPILIKYAKRSCKDLFEDLGLKNEKLLYFLNSIFGGQDFAALGFIMMMGWAHAKNAGYLKGGSFKMAERMAQYYLELGGKFRFGEKVNKILVEQDKAEGVQLESGERLYADYILSACDSHSLLYEMLDGEFIEPDFENAFEHWPLFTPLVMVGVGVGEEVDTEEHNIRYLKDMHIGSTVVEGYSITNRCMYEPDFAPEGKCALQIQFESPWENWKDLKGVAYLDEKEAIRKDILSILEGHFPGITDKIEVMDIATPRSTVRYTGVWKGAYEGFTPQKDNMNGLPMRLKGLKNFIMAGQWLFPGGGLPPSAQSGKWAIQLLMKERHSPFVVSN